MEIENTEPKKVTFTDKVITFFQKPLHKLILIVVLVILVVLFVLLLFNVGNNIEQFSTTKDLNVYYYANDQYLEYNGKVTINKNDGVSELVNTRSSLDNITDPIYYKDEDKVIFSNAVSAVIPTMGFNQSKIPSFTVIEKTSTYPKLTNDDIDLSLANAFIYNGVNTYFFLDKVTLILKKEKIELPAFSYVKCGFKDYLYIYNYETKEFKTYDSVDYMIYAETNEYKINLSTDNLTLGDQSIILTKNIEKLTNIK